MAFFVCLKCSKFATSPADWIQDVAHLIFVAHVIGDTIPNGMTIRIYFPWKPWGSPMIAVVNDGGGGLPPGPTRAANPVLHFFYYTKVPKMRI